MFFPIDYADNLFRTRKVPALAFSMLFKPALKIISDSCVKRFVTALKNVDPVHVYIIRPSIELGTLRLARSVPALSEQSESKCWGTRIRT